MGDMYVSRFDFFESGILISLDSPIWGMNCEDAMSYLLKSKARLIEKEKIREIKEEERWIEGNDDIPAGESAHAKRKLKAWTRDRGRCRYCGVELQYSECHLDHVVPRSRGGKGELDNLVVSCPACNLHKSSKTPEEAGMTLLPVPEV